MSPPQTARLTPVPKTLRMSHELILNRGDETTSNFFIFVELKKKKICYWHPGEGLKTRAFRDFKELSSILCEIEEDSFHIKAPDRYYVHLHGHWRSKNDDGVSKPFEVVRDLMLHHIDFDLSGYHNGIFIEELKEIAALEEMAGIAKGISSEVSLPLPTKNGYTLNGPHVMLWVKDIDTASELEERFLSRRANNNIYRAFSSEFNIDDFICWLDENQSSIALGAPHPFYGFSIRDKFYATGLLHYLSRWRSIINHLITKSDAVAALNSDCKDRLVVAKDSVVEGLLRKLLGKSSAREGEADMAFALSLQQESGQMPYFEPDSHINPPIDYSKDRSSLGDGINYVISNKRVGVENIFDSIKRRELVAQFLTNNIPKKAKMVATLKIVALHAYLIGKQLL